MKAGATARSRQVWPILPQRATGNTEEAWGTVLKLEQMGVIIPIAGCDTMWVTSKNPSSSSWILNTGGLRIRGVTVPRRIHLSVTHL